MKILASNREPEIATFWYIDDLGKFIGDSEPLSEGTYFGDYCQVDEDHFDRWPKWRKAYNLPDVEYDYYPRGRVMFNSKIHKFVVVCDQCIADNEKLKSDLCYTYNLDKNKVVWDTDEHYECHNCSDYFDTRFDFENLSY